MGERKSEREREQHDWYREPVWCIEALFEHVDFQGQIFDPCTGSGTIPDVAANYGYSANGADLLDRSNGRFEVRDFLCDTRIHKNIVTNPPFKRAREVVEHALDRTMGKVACFVQAKFLFSQGRFPLFAHPSMNRVLLFSRRPSVPTGQFLAEHGERARKGGSIDFCWCVWDNDPMAKNCPVVVEWIDPSSFGAINTLSNAY